jgi:FkbM family methyltransferase
MDIVEFEARNLRALEAARIRTATSREVGERNQEFKFRGFVPCCAAPGEQCFVMFNNADDVVAAHYLYAGPASFEPETLRLWVHLARQANFIFDVGAFTGVFSLAAVAAHPTCFVMAFEPSSVTYSRLLVNISANAFDARIAPVWCGLGKDNSKLDLHHPSGVYVLSSDESFVTNRVGEPWFSEAVPVLTLDHLLANQERYRTQIIINVDFPSVDLIKIDVEGFELDVLEGMRGVFERDRPTAIVEVFNLDQISAIRKIAGADYRAFYIDQLPYTPEGANVLFIHRDKLHQLDGYRASSGLLYEMTDGDAEVGTDGETTPLGGEAGTELPPGA